jgi:p-cumate 2,3-dioxygenase beta subunit
MSLAEPIAQAAPLSRQDYEDFLFHEAALLDEWRLEEWYALFADGAVYEVPTAGAGEDADSAEQLFYIADDYRRLRYRVDRLLDPGAHSEQPRSSGARLISNVRILERGADGDTVGSVFVTYRAKDGRVDRFFGHHRHHLALVDGRIRIRAKRTLLAMNSLRPQGRISVIL